MKRILLISLVLAITLVECNINKFAFKIVFKMIFITYRKHNYFLGKKGGSHSNSNEKPTKTTKPAKPTQRPDNSASDSDERPIPTGAPGQGKIKTIVLYRGLRRSNGHWATTGILPAGYNWEASFLILKSKSQNATLFYECSYYGFTRNNFISSNPGCHGQRVIGELGYIYDTPGGSFSTPLYRCYIPDGSKDHFVSLDENCEQEGFIMERKLGYVYVCNDRDCLKNPNPITQTSRRTSRRSTTTTTSQRPTNNPVTRPTPSQRPTNNPVTRPTPVTRTQEKIRTVTVYRGRVAGGHWSSSNIKLPANFIWEASFLVLKASDDDTVLWYECTEANANNFVSTDPNCEGKKYVGQFGYVYNNPRGRFSTALYRCFVQDGRGDHFISEDNNCEGAGTNEAVIGYVYACSSRECRD